MNKSSNSISYLLAALIIATPAMAEVGKNKDLANPNRATAEELQKLPHLTADIAKALIAKRPFLNNRDLDTLLAKSLSATQRTQLYAKLFVPLNLNNGPRKELLMIPRVGRRTLQEIMEYRPYQSMAQFRSALSEGYGPEEIARLEQYFFVPIDLNTASDEDILSIPGLGQRMLKEFKEYRPYKNLEQFRREIGKYVDSKEVARLERYVMIKE